MAETPDGGGGDGGPLGGITKKVGPLPLWAWGALAVVGILAYEVLRHRAAPVPTVDPNAQVDTSGDAAIPDAAGNELGILGALYSLQQQLANQNAQHIQAPKGTDPGTDANLLAWLHTQAGRKITAGGPPPVGIQWTADPSFTTMPRPGRVATYPGQPPTAIVNPIVYKVDPTSRQSFG